MTYRHIVVLTGAGVSADSGVATFRDSEGVWAKYDYRDVATPEGYRSNPTLVHEFYNGRRDDLQKVDPNNAHTALANLERFQSDAGRKLSIITQNVDNLHERAGSKNLLHMHGELNKVRCENCGDIYVTYESVDTQTKCLACGAVGQVRPHVVWFGEMPMGLDEIEYMMNEADLFVSIGTSGTVYPAAGLVNAARAKGIAAIELNLEPSENAHMFTGARYGKASEIVPAWVDELINNA